MPRVSVTIPSYNHEKFVGEAVQSVLDQTYQDFELVVCDDGSTDATAEVVAGFRDPRIRLFTFPHNRGGCTTRNRCLEEAKGEYIAILTSDDAFLPDKLEKQVRFLDENPAIGAVFGRARIIDDKGDDYPDKTHILQTIFTQPNRSRHEWLNHFFYRHNCLCHPSVLIRRECYDQVGRYDQRFAKIPDLDLWIRLCQRFDIHVLPEELVKHRILPNGANASGHGPATIFGTALEMPQSLKHYWEIPSAEEFDKIFPPRAGAPPTKKELIPFLLAMRAFEVGSHYHRAFAWESLYKVFRESSPETLKALREEHGFDYRDLALRAQSDNIFQLYCRTSRLHVDVGDDFASKRSAVSIVDTDSPDFSLRFDLSDCGPVSRLSWVPQEERLLAVRGESIVCDLKSGERISLDWKRVFPGEPAAEHFLPCLDLPVSGDFKAVTIRGRWRALGPGEIKPLINGVHEKLKQVQAAEERIRQLTAEARSLAGGEGS